MKSELIFFAGQNVGSAGHTGPCGGLALFPLAARCEAGSEATHEDCWASAGDTEEMFEVLELITAPEPGLWLTRVEYEDEDLMIPTLTWEHLTCGELEPVGPVRFEEISREVHERCESGDTTFPSTKWRWL